LMTCPPFFPAVCSSACKSPAKLSTGSSPVALRLPGLRVMHQVARIRRSRRDPGKFRHDEAKNERHPR
jgi:hypothetical protein